MGISAEACVHRPVLEDRFDAARFRRELERAGFESCGTKTLVGSVAWFTARKARRVAAAAVLSSAHSRNV